MTEDYSIGRVCNKCGAFKSWDHFCKSPTGRNGRSSLCRACRTARARADRQKNPDAYRYANKTPEQRAAMLASGKRHYRKNRDEILAKTRMARQFTKVQRAAWKKAYREKNADKISAAAKRYQKTLSPERLEAQRQSCRRYQKRYPEKFKSSVERYRQTERFRLVNRLAAHRRRALNKSAAGSFSVDQFIERCSFYGWRCYLCRCELSRATVHIEHRIPLSRGGSNWPANLAPSCKTCNSKKGRKTETEYRRLEAEAAKRK